MLKHTRDVSLIAGIVYFIQGAVGLSGIALPLFLRSLNWSISEITAITSIAAMPWIFKIFYGFLSDSIPLFGYRRKSYLVLFSVTSAVGWLLIALMPSQKTWILISLLMSNLGFAATDVITDGLIVEHSTQFTSPIYQAIAWGARSSGAVVSGIAAGWLAAHYPPQSVFLLTMFLPLSVCIAACLIKEKKIPMSPFVNALVPLSRCFRLLMARNLRFFVLILFCASISATFGTPFFFHLKETLKFPETFLGILTSIGWGGAVVGSLIYAKWLRYFSPKNTLRIAIIGNSVNIFFTFFIFSQNSALVIFFLAGVLYCLVMLPIMSSAAALTHHSNVEGTLFAVLMSVFNLGQILFGLLGAKVFPLIGLKPLILITGTLALSGLFFASRLDFDSDQQVLATPT